VQGFLFYKTINLKDYSLTFRGECGAADIEKNKNSIVLGALYEISESDEKKLDVYEDYPIFIRKCILSILVKNYDLYNAKKNNI
jgi:hypothetical protein